MEKEDISQIAFQHNSNAFYKGGKLISHKKKKKYLPANEIFNFFYVNDGALPFNSRREPILGTNIFLQKWLD